MDQRHRGLRAEVRLGCAHLAIAVVHAPLQGDELARRDPIRRPGRDDRPRGCGLVEHRQVLHADALAFLAVAARAGEVPGAGAVEVERAAELVAFLFLRVRDAGIELRAARARRDIGGKGFHLRWLVGRAEDALRGVLAAAPLQRGHAVEEPGLQVHHPVGVLEVARQPRIRALQHARAAPEVAFLERGVLRALRFFPERLALELEELGRAAFGDHLAVALDFLGAVLRLGHARRSTAHGERRAECNASHATAASVLLLSPWLSSQLTSILSPFAPPLRRNENTGLRDTAWLIWASTTGLPFTLTVRFWMKCSGTSLPSESLRCPVSIGWVISTRTSVKPWPSVARIFMGPAGMANVS